MYPPQSIVRHACFKFLGSKSFLASLSHDSCHQPDTVSLAIKIIKLKCSWKDPAK